MRERKKLAQVVRASSPYVLNLGYCKLSVIAASLLEIYIGQVRISIAEGDSESDRATQEQEGAPG